MNERLEYESSDLKNLTSTELAQADLAKSQNENLPIQASNINPLATAKLAPNEHITEDPTNDDINSSQPTENMSLNNADSNQETRLIEWISNIPQDSNAFHWAIIFAYMLPAKEQPEAFQQRFTKMFGEMQLAHLNDFNDLLNKYNPFTTTNEFFDNPILVTLLIELQSRINQSIKEESAQKTNVAPESNDQELSASELETRAISRLLSCELQIAIVNLNDKLNLPPSKISYDAHLIQLCHRQTAINDNTSETVTHYKFSLAPYSYDAYCFKAGEYYLRVNQVQNALKYFQQLESRCLQVTGFPYYYLYLGITHLQLRNYSVAYANLVQAKENSEKANQRIQLLLFSSLADCALNLKNYEEAIKHYHLALNITKEDPVTHEGLAIAYILSNIPENLNIGFKQYIKALQLRRKVDEAEVVQFLDYLQGFEKVELFRAFLEKNYDDNAEEWYETLLNAIYNKLSRYTSFFESLKPINFADSSPISLEEKVERISNKIMQNDKLIHEQTLEIYSLEQMNMQLINELKNIKSGIDLRSYHTKLCYYYQHIESELVRKNFPAIKQALTAFQNNSTYKTSKPIKIYIIYNKIYESPERLKKIQDWLEKFSRHLEELGFKGEIFYNNITILDVSTKELIQKKLKESRYIFIVGTLGLKKQAALQTSDIRFELDCIKALNKKPTVLKESLIPIVLEGTASDIFPESIQASLKGIRVKNFTQHYISGNLKEYFDNLLDVEDGVIPTIYKNISVDPKYKYAIAVEQFMNHYQRLDHREELTAGLKIQSITKSRNAAASMTKDSKDNQRQHSEINLPVSTLTPTSPQSYDVKNSSSLETTESLQQLSILSTASIPQPLQISQSPVIDSPLVTEQSTHIAAVVLATNNSSAASTQSVQSSKQLSYSNNVATSSPAAKPPASKTTKATAAASAKSAELTKKSNKTNSLASTTRTTTAEKTPTKPVKQSSPAGRVTAPSSTPEPSTSAATKNTKATPMQPTTKQSSTSASPNSPINSRPKTTKSSSTGSATEALKETGTPILKKVDSTTGILSRLKNTSSPDAKKLSPVPITSILEKNNIGAVEVSRVIDEEIDTKDLLQEAEIANEMIDDKDIPHALSGKVLGK